MKKEFKSLKKVLLAVMFVFVTALGMTYGFNQTETSNIRNLSLTDLAKTEAQGDPDPPDWTCAVAYVNGEWGCSFTDICLCD